MVSFWRVGFSIKRVFKFPYPEPWTISGAVPPPPVQGFFLPSWSVPTKPINLWIKQWVYSLVVG